MSDKKSNDDLAAENARRRRKLRWFALGAFVFLLLEVGFLTLVPHESHRGRFLSFVFADAVLAGVICVILLVSLRKE